MGDRQYAARVIAEALGLPRGTVEEVALDAGAADLSRAADLLMARVLQEDENVPRVEVLMKAVLDRMVQERADSRRPLAQLWYYPEPRPFAVFLSHDVDEVIWSWRRRLLMGLLHPSTWGTKGRHYWNFDKVMAFEQAHRLTSSFFVVPQGSHPRDPPYALSDITETIVDMSSKGWEIGLHASYESFDDLEMMRVQKGALEKALGRPVHGVRQHFINFESPLTWRLQDEAGFIYDSTMATNEHPGFRTGFCHPYRPEGLSLLEIPLVVMDGQLFWHEELDVAGAYARTKSLLHTVAEYNGVACLNWHQHTMDEYSFPGWWEVLRRNLEGLMQMEPWVARGIDIAAWWNRRARIQFEEVNVSPGTGTWRLVDPAGGVATLRIVPPEGEGHKIKVDGVNEYDVADQNGTIWVRFGNLPAGEPVEISVRPT